MIKSNILFIIDKSGFGGVQTIASNLINYRLVDNFNIYYFFLRNINLKNNVKYINKNNVFYSKTSNKFDFRSFFELTTIIKEKNISIVHMNGDKCTVYSSIIKRLLFPSLKIIHHEHSGIFRNSLLYPSILRLFKNTIDRFIAVSERTKYLLIEKSKIKEEKIIVLHNFVDLKKFSPIHKNNKKKEKKFIIGYSGRLEHVKGCDILIKSLVHLQFDYHLIIAGDGTEMHNLKKIVYDLKLVGNVTFVGFCSNIRIIYEGLDVLVIPSRSEACPMTLLEAQSMGIPVVVSDIFNPGEFVKNHFNGLLFKCGDYEDLASKLSILKNNENERSNISQNSLLSAKNYSLDNYVKKLEKIYNELF